MVTTTKCGHCGVTIDPTRDPPGKRLPCDECGSIDRAITECLTEGVQIGAHFRMLQRRQDEIIAFIESVRKGLASFGFKDQDGSLRYGLQGRPTQGEDDTHGVCRQLINRLNQEGTDWCPPTAGTADADCEAKSKSDPTRLLHIQVVRADADTQLWQELGKTGSVGREEVQPQKLAQELYNAIDKKARRIPPERRTKLLLALDATRLPAHAFKSVVQAFFERFEGAASNLGFREIWLVGPSESMTTRLACLVSN